MTTRLKGTARPPPIPLPSPNLLPTALHHSRRPTRARSKSQSDTQCYQRSCKTATLSHQHPRNGELTGEGLPQTRRKQETEILGVVTCSHHQEEEQPNSHIHQLTTNSQTIEPPRNKREQEEERIQHFYNVSTNNHERLRRQGKEKDETSLPPSLSYFKGKSKNGEKLSDKLNSYSLHLHKYKSEIKSHATRAIRSPKTIKQLSSLTEQQLSTGKGRVSNKRGGACKGNTRQQQPTLAQKLQKFKFDVLKLVDIYEESSLVGSKVSTPPFKHLQPLQSSSPLRCESELKDRIEEMKQFQGSVGLVPQEKGTLEVHNEEVSTKEIVNNYIDSRLTRLEDKQFNLLASIHPIQIDESAIANSSSSASKPVKSISGFFRFLKQKHSTFKENTLSELEDCMKAYQADTSNSNRQAIASLDANISIEIDADIQLNQQLQLLQQTRAKLSLQLNEDLSSLEDWEQRYKNELLRMKKRMWAQYEVIRQMVQHRTSNGIDQPSVAKGKRVMKCLSENNIWRSFKQEQSFSSDSSSGIGMTFKHNRQPDYFQPNLRLRQYLPTIVHEELNDSDIGMYDGDQGVTFDAPDANILIDSSISWNNEEIKLESNCPQVKKKILSQCQKEDVFEYIFLDLVLELYEEPMKRERFGLTNDRQLTSMRRILSSIEEYIRDSKVNQSISNKKIGFSTNLNTIRAVTAKLVQFLSSNIYAKESPLTVREKLLKNLNTSIGPTNAQMLRSLRYDVYQDEAMIISGEQDYEECEILQPSLFQYFQHHVVKVKQLSFEGFFEDEVKEKERFAFLRNAVHIHHKAIFDCFNEVLDFHRIYGIWGKPFTWKTKAKAVQLVHDLQVQKVLQKCMEVCLKMPDSFVGFQWTRRKAL